MTPSSARLVIAYLRGLRDLGESEVLCETAGVGGEPRPIEGSASLQELAREIEACRACGLGATRTHTVPGAGNPTSGLVMVGEAPGEQEDAQGRPFVGPSGRLLRTLFSLVGIPDDRYFLVNVLKCRPPGNRNPTTEEMDACGGFLRAQLEILAPRLIVCLGKFAGERILGRPDVSIRRMRGTVLPRGSASVVVTYHPSALLHRVEFRADAWRDIKRIRRLADQLGIPLEGGTR